MPKNVTQYSLLISCPGDIKDEIDIIEQCVQKFNDMYSDALNISIITKYWKKNSYPKSGDKPQNILNEQYVNNCDAAVALFWTRFGTPTDKYGSGTEEEISIMLESDKQVFMYFSDKPVSPSQQNSKEYKRVKAFKEKYKGKGLYFDYSSNEAFDKLFFAHLTQYFISQKQIAEIQNKNYSQLRLVGINEKGKIDEKASIYPFVFNTNKSIKALQEKNDSLIKKIADIEVGEKHNSPISQYTVNLSTPVSINEEDQKLIKEYAKIMGIEIPTDFYKLGDLSKSTISNPLIGIELIGNKQEKNKYKLIQELLDSIRDLLVWFPIENEFSKMNCIRLALQNSGKAIDEDVEISMEFPCASFMMLKQFPQISYYEKEYLISECDVQELFGIDSTSEYFTYDRLTYMKPTSIPGMTVDYDKEYIKALKRAFCYTVYKEEEKYIIKLNVKYIKHNTTVAFPSVIMINDNIEEIPYVITSKHNPEMFKGTLKVL